VETGNAIVLAVSLVLIFAYTAYNIWIVRRRARLYRMLQEILKRQQEQEKEPPIQE